MCSAESAAVLTVVTVLYCRLLDIVPLLVRRCSPSVTSIVLTSVLLGLRTTMLPSLACHTCPVAQHRVSTAHNAQLIDLSRTVIIYNTTTYNRPRSTMSIATRAVDERVWRLRQVQAGPKAELFILPLILEKVIAMRQGGLRAHYNEDTKHIFINASDDDCIQTLKTYGGLIGRVKQILPAMFTYKVTIECYHIVYEPIVVDPDSTSMARIARVFYSQHVHCVRRALAWFVDMAAFVEKEYLHAIVAPPEDDALPRVVNTWAQWMKIYHLFAQEVEELSYDNDCIWLRRYRHVLPSMYGLEARDLIWTL